MKKLPDSHPLRKKLALVEKSNAEHIAGIPKRREARDAHSGDGSKRLLRGIISKKKPHAQEE